MNMSRVKWIEVVCALAILLSSVMPLSAQEITESWVAEQLDRSRAAEPTGLGGEMQPGMPLLSLMIRYLPETGELTLTSAAALRPLYHALSALAPASFQVVCCTGLPTDRQPVFAQQLVEQMSRLFADRQPHVQFRVQAPNLAIPPQVYPADTARIDIYRLP